MFCEKCKTENKQGAVKCKNCGALLKKAKKKDGAPSSIKIDMINPETTKRQIEEMEKQTRGYSKGLVAAIIIFASLLLAGLILLGIFLFAQPGEDITVPVQTQQPAPSETATPLPTPTQAPTTAPTQTEQSEYSSLFEEPPEDLIIPEQE